MPIVGYASKHEPAVAMDLFEDQISNVDRSGEVPVSWCPEICQTLRPRTPLRWSRDVSLNCQWWNEVRHIPVSHIEIVVVRSGWVLKGWYIMFLMLLLILLACSWGFFTELMKEAAYQLRADARYQLPEQSVRRFNHPIWMVHILPCGLSLKAY